MTPRTATLIGLTAILMWSLLAVLTVATGTTPAFQLAAMTFAIGAAVGFLTWIGRPGAARALLQSPLAWMVGIGGLFGYHALYFLALRFAPPAEAGLLNYLWPLLIVLFSSLVARRKAGAAPYHRSAIGIGRHRVVVRRKSQRQLCARPVARADRGVCRRVRMGGLFGDVAQAQIGTDRCGRRLLSGDGAARGVGARVVEATVWPETAAQWLAIAALGVGPVGAAFYAWDIGMKRGDIRVLGAASYATPLLSTAFLMLAGFARPSIAIAVAAVLIAGGGLIAAKDMVWKKSL